jgi:hypothetical protein
MWGYSSLALFNPYKSYVLREIWFNKLQI